MQSAVEASGRLLPRYRRPLSVSAVLDEAFRLHRRGWMQLAVITAVETVPYYVISTQLRRSEPAPLPPSGDLTEMFFSQGGAGFLMGWLDYLIAGVAYAVTGGALTVCANRLMRGGQPSIRDSYRAAWRRAFPLVLSSGLFYLLIVPVSFGAILSLLLWILPGLFGLTPLLALVVWGVRPAARSVWLKWLIILTTPGGLFLYYFVAWAQVTTAVVLEGAGPLRAYRRSQELLRGNWLRGAAVFLVPTIVLLLFLLVPTLILSLAAGVGGGAPSSEELAIVNGFTSLIVVPLVSSLGYLATVVLYVDLRNRHEGADLDERVGLLEPEAGQARG